VNLHAAPTSNAPILIVGAGPVGMTAALALNAAGQSVRIIDAGAALKNDDPRAVALSHGSRVLLERLGVWPAEATPIRHIRVSQEGGFGQTRIEAKEQQIDALGYTVRLGTLSRRLMDGLLQAGIEVNWDSALEACTARNDGVTASVIAQLSHAQRRSAQSSDAQTNPQTGATQVETPLVLLAEGRPSGTTDEKDFAQTALVFEAHSPSQDRATHQALAHERFTSEGPLALLPLEKSTSVVWCMAPARADAMGALSDAEFLKLFNERVSFASRRYTSLSARAAYPLKRVARTAESHSREIALGNAAQTLHPVAGQGLNLGLRDAMSLANALRDGVREEALAAWHSARARDRRATIALTDGYVSLFSNDLAPVRHLRGLGLTLLNLIPPLRSSVARRMMFGVR
jgi:2-octaprenyl-6-methoxyphenol hydroxylase